MLEGLRGVPVVDNVWLRCIFAVQLSSSFIRRA